MFIKKQDNLGQELQCTLKVKEDLSSELNFQDAKNNVFKLIKIKKVLFSIYRPKALRRSLQFIKHLM